MHILYIIVNLNALFFQKTNIIRAYVLIIHTFKNKNTEVTKKRDKNLWIILSYFSN